MTDIRTTLNERKTTHGDFSDNARITQEIEKALQSGPEWQEATSVEREALHMIAHKMARIVSGNPHYDDSWRDIAGYATLVVDRL